MGNGLECPWQLTRCPQKCSHEDRFDTGGRCDCHRSLYSRNSSIDPRRLVHFSSVRLVTPGSMLVETTTLSGAARLVIVRHPEWPGPCAVRISILLRTLMHGLPEGQLALLGFSMVAFIMLGTVLKLYPQWHCSGLFSFRSLARSEFKRFIKTLQPAQQLALGCPPR